MRPSGTATKYPGVYKTGKGTYRVRGRVPDPRTGKRKEVDRVLHNVTLQQAVYKRSELMAALENETLAPVEPTRVGVYATSWIRSKALKVDQGTAERYALTLEQHVLPTLGDFYYNALKKRDVQAWVDAKLTETIPETNRCYAVRTVHSWFRVLRTMTRDAMEDLEFDRDPTRRISFPDDPQPKVPNSLMPDELCSFLDFMRERYPHHFGLSVLLAYTGLRFCHASAVRWEDWDQDAQLIRVVRKQVRGRVGPVTRKKQAPREIPVDPELGDVLLEHRAWMEVNQWPGRDSGWMFLSSAGTLRAQSGMAKAWRRCLDAAGITRRFTVHGMRYTFTDLVREANVDPVVRRALTGHVTEVMQRHYSTVKLDEKRDALGLVHRNVPLTRERRQLCAEVSLSNPPFSKGGTFGGTTPKRENDRRAGGS